MICVLWIVGGVAVLVWLGRSIELLPAVLSLLLILGGLGSLAGVSRGRASERVLAVASGGAQIVFGILALVWPDLTLLIAAVLFGVRTTIYGASLDLARGPSSRRKARLGGGSGRHAATSTASGCRQVCARGGLRRARRIRLVGQQLAG